MAVRFGRRRCVKFLLNKLKATVDVPDGRGMSAVGCAAWIGDNVLLKELLNTGQPVNLERRGKPFKTSSCGGEGPYKPREWARRKGFLKCVMVIDAYERGGIGGGGGRKEDR